LTCEAQYVGRSNSRTYMVLNVERLEN